MEPVQGLLLRPPIAWKWFLALATAAAANFFSPTILYYTVFNSEADPYGVELHFIWGRVLVTTMILWSVLFGLACTRHHKHALWGLLFLPVLLYRYIEWARSILL